MWLVVQFVGELIQQASTGRRGIYIGIVYKTSNFSMVEERWALVKLGIVAAV